MSKLLVDKYSNRINIFEMVDISHSITFLSLVVNTIYVVKSEILEEIIEARGKSTSKDIKDIYNGLVKDAVSLEKKIKTLRKLWEQGKY